MSLSLSALPGLAGCVLGSDSDPPELAVDLYWETARSSEYTCRTAHVATMDLRLLDSNDEVLEERQGAKCADGFRFTHVDPGNYVLEITGYDADQNPTWRGECALYLDRFDRLFRCDVTLTTP